MSSYGFSLRLAIRRGGRLLEDLGKSLFFHKNLSTPPGQGPFLNPLEQNNPSAKLVCIKVRDSSYADLFEQGWGPDSLDCVQDVTGTYERIARSIAAYENRRK